MKQDDLNEKQPGTGLTDKSNRRGFFQKVVKGVLAAGLFIGAGSQAQAAQPVSSEVCVYCTSACQTCNTLCQLVCQGCNSGCQTACDTGCDVGCQNCETQQVA